MTKMNHVKLNNMPSIGKDQFISAWYSPLPLVTYIKIE